MLSTFQIHEIKNILTSVILNHEISLQKYKDIFGEDDQYKDSFDRLEKLKTVKQLLFEVKNVELKKLKRKVNIFVFTTSFLITIIIYFLYLHYI